MCCGFGIRCSKESNGMSTKKFKSLNLHVESILFGKGTCKLLVIGLPLVPYFVELY